MGEWDEWCKEWVGDVEPAGSVYACTIADEKGVLYGAWAQEGDAWAQVFKDPRQEQLAISEEEAQTVEVDETAILAEVLKNTVKAKLPSGLWLGGNKYTLVREQDLDHEGTEVKFLYCQRPKGGCGIAVAGGYAVLGFIDENKGQSGKTIGNVLIPAAAAAASG